MSQPSRIRRLITPSEQPATGRRAWLFGLLWFALATLAVWGAVWIAIHLTFSVALRIVLVIVLLVLSTSALMLASDSAERALNRSPKETGWLYWVSTSVVALALVVSVGAAASSLAPDRPGAASVAIDFPIDVALGALAGVLATGLILAVGGVSGHVIWSVQRGLGVERERRWRQPGDARARLAFDFGRGAAMGGAGLLLSAVWTAFITTITTNHTGAAETPVHRESSVLLTVFLPVLWWFAGTGGMWLLFARWRHRDFEAHPRLRRGTHASALSVCLLIAISWVAAASLEQHARRALWSGRPTAVPVVSVTAAQASRQSPYLAVQFEPQLWLATGERWVPTTVSWYVNQNPRPNTDPPFCNARQPGQPAAGCYQIRPPCDDADPGPCALSGAGDEALYYRYVDAANASTRDRKPSAAGGAWTLIQYWIFYNYDSLHTWAVTQWHQADWEQVSVLVQRRGATVRPVEVSFSQHCYGARLPAERVQWTNGSHPAVFVAEGSHANYPRPVSVPVRQLRCSLGVTPRYLGVAGLFFAPAIDGSRLEIPVAYLAGLRDSTDRTRQLPLLRLVALDTASEIQSFNGNWGLDNNLRPLGVGRLRSGAGPPAPQTQGPWGTPYRSMICSGSWLSTKAIPRSETAWTCTSP